MACGPHVQVLLAALSAAEELAEAPAEGQEEAEDDAARPAEPDRPRAPRAGRFVSRRETSDRGGLACRNAPDRKSTDQIGDKAFG